MLVVKVHKKYIADHFPSVNVNFWFMDYFLLKLCCSGQLPVVWSDDPARGAIIYGLSLVYIINVLFFFMINLLLYFIYDYKFMSVWHFYH